MAQLRYAPWTVAGEQTRAAFGLRVHTGWAALVAGQRSALFTEAPRSAPHRDDRRTRSRARGYQPVASAVIVGNQPFDNPLDQILKAHSLIHAAEGELYRHAIMSASEACGLAVTPVRARELEAPGLRKVLTDVGRRAGRPWAQDQKESLLAALVALGA
jgi:hypothetical protein